MAIALFVCTCCKTSSSKEGIERLEGNINVKYCKITSNGESRCSDTCDDYGTIVDCSVFDELKRKIEDKENEINKEMENMQ